MDDWLIGLIVLINLINPINPLQEIPMTQLPTQNSATRFSGTQFFLGIGGMFYTLTGLALLFIPTWFFTYIGDFPPFNRHYMGDAGAFVLPLGIGLLLAIREPAANKTIILLTAVGSLVHALNHAYDDWLAGSSLLHWFYETIPLIIFAGILFWIYRQLSR
jgi:hypothetical protein